MAASNQTHRDLYQRAGGRCECTMQCSHHKGRRCQHQLHSGQWHAHHRSRNGGDGLSNLIAMCRTCHKNTRTWGQH